MRFLVTGGAGFLGSALANRLVRAGHTVRVLDDLSAGDPARLDPQVMFTRGDVSDVPKLWTLLQGIDCVYHLAARVSVPESILYPRDYNAVNVGGTVAVMEAMRDAGVKRVVFTSSGAVYGEQEQQPVCEHFSPNPGSPYAASKASAEHYVRTIGKLWGIETVILRVFNAYGPGQAVPPAHAPVIPQLLKQALGGGSLVVFGDGRQSRDFVYVEDVVDGLITAATARNVDRQIINIGSGTEVSINAITGKIGRIAGRQVNVIHSGAQTGGVTRLCADITQAKQLLGFAPKVDLDTGLKLTLERDPQFKSSQRG